MLTKIINDIKVEVEDLNPSADGSKEMMGDEEILYYIKSICDENPGMKLETLKLSINNEFVDTEYSFKTTNFSRIRRITGYLVGTVDRWNDAKRAELNDRVKHI